MNDTISGPFSFENIFVIALINERAKQLETFPFGMEIIEACAICKPGNCQWIPTGKF